MSTAAVAGRPALEPLYAAMAQRVVGQRRLVDRMLIALLVQGHLLVEGLPGIAKTLAIQTFAELLHLKCQRVQFTPDLLPADILGTQVWLPGPGKFELRPGPIVANIVLADEINRAPAKVQSALLQAMQERQVTLAGETIHLPVPFMVLATQNPIDQEGTYPLPEAQLDRFLMKVVLDYPSRDEERLILQTQLDADRFAPIEAILDAATLAQFADAVRKTHVDGKVNEYVLDLVRATRGETVGKSTPLGVQCGASPRAAVYLLRAARAHAWLSGRDYVLPADVQALAEDVLAHRVVLDYEAEANGMTPRSAVRRLLAEIPVP